MTFPPSHSPENSEHNVQPTDVETNEIQPADAPQVLAETPVTPPTAPPDRARRISKPMLASALALGAAGCVALSFWAAKNGGDLGTGPTLVVATAAPNATTVPTTAPLVFTAPNPKAPGANPSKTQLPNGILNNKPANALSNLPATPAKGGANARANDEVTRAFASAVEAQKAGKIEEALKWYRVVLQKQPQALEARTNMAILFAQNKQPAQAVEQLEAARKLAPENPAINWQLAQLKIALKQPKAALVPLNVVLKADPKNVPAHVLKAQILTESKEFAEAYKAWEQVAAMTPKDGQAALAAGSIALQELRRPQDAEKWLRRANALPPANPRAPLALAQALLAQKKADSAARFLTSAVKKYPKVIELGTTLSDARAAAGDLKGATSALRAVIARVPKKSGEGYGQLRWQLGRLLAEQKEWKSAQSELQAAAKEMPKNADLRGSLAEIALQAGDRKTGMASLKTLLELDPKRVSARVVLAQVLAQDGNFKSADEQYRKYLQAKPSDAAIVSERAVVLEKLGRTDDALRLWQRVGQLLPDNPLPILQRGRVLRAAKRDKEALQVFRQVLQMKPNEPRALLNAAEIETQNGQYSSATARWKALIGIEPDYEAAYTNLMESARKDKNSAQSLEASANFLKAQLAKNPARPVAYRAILNSYQKAGRGKEGRAFVDNLARLFPKAKAPREALAAYDRQSKTAETKSTPTPALTIAPPTPSATPAAASGLDASATPQIGAENEEKTP